jgi:putative cell wall-binding protein
MTQPLTTRRLGRRFSPQRGRRITTTIAVGAVVAVGAPLAGIFALGSTASGATPLGVVRLAGADRYATAAAIADERWTDPLPANSTLLLATGSTFPDAVAGSAAAGYLNVPLLLTTSGALSASAAAEIRRLQPASVTLLGGTSAISSAVAQQVEEVGPPVVRWQGTDRYATAAAISQATYPGGAATVYLATGGAFPDALTGAALAAHAGGPLLLTDPDTLPASTTTEIARLHPSAIVIFGGTSAVSAQVASAAAAAAGGATLSRISGADRYATADAVASALVHVDGGTGAGNGVFITTGLDFPDALAGAASGGATDRPLLLVPQSYMTPHTWQTIIQDLQPPGVFILGGTNAVSAAIATGIMAGNPPLTPPT